LGEVTADEVISKLSYMPYQDLGFVKADHHRELRTGFPEVIFGQGKTTEQVVSISNEILKFSERLMITRASDEMYSKLKKLYTKAQYHHDAKAITVDIRDSAFKEKGVLIVTAGTSDLQVAKEAQTIAELMDCQVKMLIDVGVAGLHRLLDNLDEIKKHKVIVAVAGMDGVLPAVLAGIVKAPVIAVPTSIGYGASFEGIGPLLTMLNSCAPGVSVVNIDNGFGAGYLAAMINKSMKD
jgi:NCAIR mutase (PurE)-related protein